MKNVIELNIEELVKFGFSNKHAYIAFLNVSYWHYKKNETKLFKKHT